MGNKFLSNWIVRNLLGAVILVLAIVIVVAICLGIVTKHGKEIGVPDFSYMSIEEAERLAEDNSLALNVVDSVFVNRMEPGAIFSQNPVAGSHVKSGRRIAVTINAFEPKKLMMPNLVGYSLRQARAELISKGLKLRKLIYVEDMATNNVLRQLYKNNQINAGEMVENGAEIDLVLGLNSTDRETFIPDVSGLRYNRAIDEVQDNYLNIGRLNFDSSVETYSDTLNSVVYRQTPAASTMTVRMGSEVNLYLTTDVSKVPSRD